MPTGFSGRAEPFSACEHGRESPSALTGVRDADVGRQPRENREHDDADHIGLAWLGSGYSGRFLFQEKL